MVLGDLPRPLLATQVRSWVCLCGVRATTEFFCFCFCFLFVFIFFWLRWVFAAMCGLSLVVASGGYSLLWCVGFSLRWLLLLWSMDSRCVGSVVVAHGLSSCGLQALGVQAQ